MVLLLEMVQLLSMFAMLFTELWPAVLDMHWFGYVEEGTIIIIRK
jgi:hypothetical protein